MLSYLRRTPDVVVKLQNSPATCAAFEADGECAIAIKCPGVEPIEFLGQSPKFFYDLDYKRMPTAPVFYLVVYILDGQLKDRPCTAAFDVCYPDERRLIDRLTKQSKLRVFFMNSNLDPLEQHVCDWDSTLRERALVLLAQAVEDLADFPIARHDFQAALLDLWAGTGETTGEPNSSSNP